jgi:hypothetical protein
LEEKKGLRKGQGLDEREIDIKDPNKDPSLNYVAKPAINSKTMLENKRKEEMLEKLK